MQFSQMNPTVLEKKGFLSAKLKQFFAGAYSIS